MESEPQNPEFRNTPENFHPWIENTSTCISAIQELSCKTTEEFQNQSKEGLSVVNQNKNNTESFAHNHIPEGGCELSKRFMDATEMYALINVLPRVPKV